MADDKVQVIISASADDFNQGIEEAVSQLNSSISQMTSMFSQLSSSIASSMNQAASNASSATAKMADGIKSNIESTVSSVETLKTKVGAIGISIAAALGSATKSALDHEKAMLGLSRNTGMSIEEASRWSFAAQMSGVNTEVFSNSLVSLSRQLLMAEKSMATGHDRFSEYGVAVKDTNGALLPTGQILENIAARYQTLTPGIERTRFAYAMFRGDAQAMIPFLEKGASGLQQLREQADKYGAVLKDASAIKSYAASQRQLNGAIEGFKMQVGNALLPVVTGISTAISNLVKAFNSMDPGIRNAIIQITAFGGVALSVVGGMAALRTGLAAIGFEKLAGMISSSLNPLSLLQTGFTGLVGNLTDATMAVTKYIFTGGLFTTISNTMNTVMETTKAVLTGVRSGIVITSAAFQIGGVRGIVSYIASLVSMNTIVTVARGALMLLYGTVVAGVAVVAGLALAWTTNFGNIQQATAGFCDGISYGLNTFANGIKQWAMGIAKVFSSLAHAVANAFKGDFSAAWESVKGIGDGIVDMAKGMGNAFKGVGQAAYAALSNPEGAWNYMKAAGGAIWKGVNNMMTPDSLESDGSRNNFTPNLSPGSGTNGGGENGNGGKEQSSYELAKQQYEAEVSMANFSTDEKIAKYKYYLEKVQNGEKEKADYLKGLHELENSQFEESLKTQTDSLKEQLDQGEITQEDYLNEEIKLKEKALNRYLQQEIANRKAADQATGAPVKSDDAYATQVKATKQYQDALKGVYDDEKKIGNLQADLAKKEKEILDQSANNAIEEEEKKYQRMYELGQISSSQLYDHQKQIENNRNQDELARIQNENQIKEDQWKILGNKFQAYLDAKTGTARKQLLDELLLNTKNKEQLLAIWKQLEQNYKTHTDKMNNINLKETKDSPLSQIADSMKSSMTTMLSSVMKGTTSIKNAFKTMAQSIYGTIVDLIAKQMTQAIFKSLDTTVAASNGAAASASTGILGILESVGTALSSIPWYGWVGLAILAAVSSAQSSTSSSTSERSSSSYYQSSSVSGLPSYDVGSWSLPSDTIAQVHKGEMIVPAKGGFADSVRSMMSGGSNGISGGSSAQVNHSPTYNISAMDSKGVGRVLKDNSRQVTQSLYRVQRSMARQNATRWGLT